MLANSGMPSPIAFALLLAAAVSYPHVRPESADAQALVRQASDRSPVVRALLDRLNASDVVAYVRFTRFRDADLEGRVGFLSEGGGRRYVVVELACGRIATAQIVTLAHELQHVVEIAEAPAVVNARTLAEHYARIGIRTTRTWRDETFETQAALETSTLVRRELMAPAVRTTEEE